MGDVDLLAGRAWSCGRTDPGAILQPDGLDRIAEWWPAAVPGTVAGALRDAGGWAWGQDDEELLDGSDWWYRVEVPPGGPALLELGGLATVADVWCGGRHLLRSESMFVGHRVRIEARSSPETLVVRFAALAPLLDVRRPRPRWRSLLHRSQRLRWYRTTTLGRNGGWTRCGAPVGPWRAVTLTSLDRPVVRVRSIRSELDGDVGVVQLDVDLLGAGVPSTITITIGDVVAQLPVSDGRAAGALRIASPERWWPHTHGDPVLYPVAVLLGEDAFDVGSVGFRSVEVDSADGGFAIKVNGVAVFCRGATWDHPDLIGFNAPPEALRRSLTLARDGGCNLLRVAGHSVYETERFWKLCDELGLLVWQDCILAAYDPPEDAEWLGLLEDEVCSVVTAAAAHPALAMVCGSSEVHQQAAMYGLPLGSWTSTALDKLIPSIVSQCAPGISYVPSSPSAGVVPFATNAGPAHYFGVGAYLRPLTDARVSDVRFASECLAFSRPPERSTVDEAFGGPGPAAHSPEWKAAVPRDASTSWDFEDVTDHYVEREYGVGPLDVRYANPGRALDLKRAVTAQVSAAVLTEWRRPTSACAGGLILTWQDAAPGAGWGLIDAQGRPKSAWYALRRVLAPTAVTITDDGLLGYTVQVHHDGPGDLLADLELAVYGEEQRAVHSASRRVVLAPHSSVEISVIELLDTFRDLNDAYAFGPSPYEVVVVALRDELGRVLSKAVQLCRPPDGRRTTDIGLTASAESVSAGVWRVTVSARRFAWQVALDVEGAEVSDSWFDLEPGGAHDVVVRTEKRLTGTVRALNGTYESPIVLDGAPSTI